MSRLTIRLLGTPLITVDGEPIKVDTRKAIALLVYLVVTRQTHRRSALAVLFWPDSDQQRGRTALRRTLAALNKAIGKEWIEADRVTICLNTERKGLWVDVNRLRGVASALAHPAGNNPDNQLDTLQEVADLYRGDFLEGFTLTDSHAFDDWQFFQAEQAQQDIGTVWQKLVYGLTQEGAFESAIEYARKWLALDPLQETPHQQLIQLYAWAGQRSAALRQYNECVRILDEEIGVPPQDETTAIYEQVLNYTLVEHPAGVTSPPPTLPKLATAIPAEPPKPAPSPSRTGRPRHNLPQPAGAFVGREQELADVMERLDQPNCRLVTLIGPGGAGKTRLALEVANVRREQYVQGVYFAPLADINEASYLDAFIAETVRFTFYGRGEQRTQLLDYLRDKELLLVLDNFEHVLEGIELIASILQQAPQVQLLITTQERLHLREEWLYEIDAFRCPEADEAIERSSAYQLFLQRAWQVKSGFRPGELDKQHIAQICRAVGGLALGIELAASWIRILSPSEIVSQMAEGLDFLTTSLRDVPERHRSLRAIFSYSWELLTDQERETFTRLAVFQSGFEIPPALSIARISLPSVLTLTDKSLLRQTISGRYEIPAVLRTYAQDKFNNHPKAEVIRGRHAHHYLTFLAERGADLKGSGQKAALQAVQSEIENIRWAWREAFASGQANSLLEALPCLLLFYETRSWFAEGLNLFREAAQHPLAETSSRLRGQLQMAHGACLYRLARFEEAEVQLQDALAQLRILDDKLCVALTLYYLGIVGEATGRVDQALTYLQESLNLHRITSEHWGAAAVLNALGNVAFTNHDYSLARQHYEESLLMRRHIGDQRGIAVCYHNLGNVPLIIGEYNEAKQLYRESLRLHRELQDSRGIGHALNNIGYVAWLQGLNDEADHYLQLCLTTLTEIGDQRGIAHAQQNLGHVALTNNQLTEAQTLYEESRYLFQVMGDPAGMADLLVDFGNVAQKQKRNSVARRWYLSALEEAYAIEATTVLLGALGGLAQLDWLEGNKERAIQLAQMVLIHPDTPLSTRRQMESKAVNWQTTPTKTRSLMAWVEEILSES